MSKRFKGPAAVTRVQRMNFKEKEELVLEGKTSEISRKMKSLNEHKDFATTSTHDSWGGGNAEIVVERLYLGKLSVCDPTFTEVHKSSAAFEAIIKWAVTILG